MTRGLTRLTSRWWCLDCEEHTDYGLTMSEAGKQAQAHTNETGHATATSSIPLR